MGLFQRLGLRRVNKWEKPTLIDQYTDSPLQALVSHIFHFVLFLRGGLARLGPSNGTRRPIRVVCLSDTHDRIPASPIPDGDLLIHCGDLTDQGTVTDIQKQLDFLALLPHKHKVIIAGNHDSYFDPKSRRAVDKSPTAPKLDFKGIYYLEHESVRLNFDNGRILHVYGAPDIPACGGPESAFQYDRAHPPWRNTIPKEVDILVTHTPPAHHLDLGLGCVGLLEEVWRVRPRLHVFGHVHWGRGRQIVYFDQCQQAYEQSMTRRSQGLVQDLLVPSAAWVDVIKVLYHGVSSVLWSWLMEGPASRRSASLMVNAACMHGNTGRLRLAQAEVVEI